MALQKFTVFLIPDEEGYQVIVPHYPGCTTWGETPQEAFANAREAMELILEVEAEDDGNEVPENAHADHVIVGDVDVEVPDRLSEALQKESADVGT